MMSLMTMKTMAMIVITTMIVMRSLTSVIFDREVILNIAWSRLYLARTGPRATEAKRAKGRKSRRWAQRPVSRSQIYFLNVLRVVLFRLRIRFLSNHLLVFYICDLRIMGLCR